MCTAAPKVWYFITPLLDIWPQLNFEPSFLQELFYLVPVFPCAQTKNLKKREEPGKIYHMRNVTGRENLITRQWTNELAHGLLTENSCESFMVDRMGLDSTMLYYLAVQWAMVSVLRPIYLKITITYSLTWKTEHSISQKMVLKVLLNAKAVLS